MASAGNQWPDLPLAAWSGTCDTLQLWTQVAGKVRVALTPLINHWWNATFHVTARGLAAPATPYARGSFDMTFDFVAHRMAIETSEGGVETISLAPMTVADFHAAFMERLHRLGIEVGIRTMPCEIPGAVPFDQDRTHAQYDREYAVRFHRVLVRANRLMTEFRARFLGKVSPVHFFWGSFDLAVTRFSGRRAPPHPGGVPNLPDAVVREAYSHEVSSCGFWPGGPGMEEAIFYAYAYPEPPGFRDARIEPPGAGYNAAFGEFVLPYEAVRTAPDPDGALMAFLASTYAAAADAGSWDRAALECGFGQPGIVRKV